jgi:trehalose/maltose hydrolase-like predicted phosphorylase
MKKVLNVVTKVSTGEQISLLRESSDFEGFTNPNYVKENYGINKSNTKFRQNATYVNPRIHVDIISGEEITLTKVMEVTNSKELSIARKLKSDYNKLFKLQSKYYSTIK